METKYELKTMTQNVPKGSTADDVATIVRSILRLPFHVSNISIDPSGVTWKAYLPKTEPPDGTVMDPVPGDLTELMSKIDLTEIPGTKTGLNLKSFALVGQMLLEVSKKSAGDGVVSGMRGTSWIVGSKKEFCLWLGVRPDKPPTKFMNLPLLENDELPFDRLVLLCARSDQSDYLESEGGVVMAMVRKEKK